METRVPIGLGADGKFVFKGDDGKLVVHKEGEPVTVRFGSTDLTGFLSTPPEFHGFVSHGALMDELEHFTKTGRLYTLPEDMEATFEWKLDPPARTIPWSDPKSDPLDDMKKVMEHFDKWPDPPPLPISEDDWKKVRAARRPEPTVMPFSGPTGPGGMFFGRREEYVQVPRELMAALLESLGGSFTITVDDMRAAAMQNGPRTVVVDRWVDQSQGMMYRMRVEEPRP